VQWTGPSDQLKTVKVTGIKFDVHVRRVSTDITPYFFRKGGVARVTWLPNCWALNTNSSKMVIASDYKFDMHVSRDSPDMTA